MTSGAILLTPMDYARVPRGKIAMSTLSSRNDDERDLSILRRACSGERYSDIAREFGRAETFARVIVARIRDADLRESGEASSVILANYPKPRSGRVRG